MQSEKCSNFINDNLFYLLHPSHKVCFLKVGNDFERKKIIFEKFNRLLQFFIRDFIIEK